MRIGLLPMSAKPYHAGHDGLVRIAARECDEVHLFVSLSDRKRPGEMTIRGEAMQEIWETFIIPSLPANVRVVYSKVPVASVYAEIENAEKSGDIETEFSIYSDDEDIVANFPISRLTKNAPGLYERGQITLRGIKRSETVPVSGTKMRDLLQTGDYAAFAEYLPPAIRQHSKEIVGMLMGENIAESLIRSYVRSLLS